MTLRGCNEQLFCSAHEDTETPRTHALYEPKLLLESEMLLLLLMARRTYLCREVNREVIFINLMKCNTRNEFPVDLFYITDVSEVKNNVTGDETRQWCDH